MVAVESLDVICITETWLDTAGRDFEGEYHLPGYKMFHKDRSARVGGGVMIYVRSHIDAVLKSINSPYELLGIEIRCDVSLHLYLLYRPPNQTQDHDRNLYAALTDLLQDETAVLLGDFNCRVDWSTQVSAGEGGRLIDFSNDNFLTQMVRSPTRGSNILDLVFTTDEDLITQVSVGECLGSSDHNAVSFRVGVGVEQEQISHKSMLNLRRADYDGFTSDLQALRLQLPASPDEMWQGFKADYNSIQERRIPRKRVGGSRKVHPKWFHDNLGNEIRRRKRLYVSAKTFPTPENERLLINQRRLVKKMVRQAKVAEEHRVALACKGNPKEFFSYVNSRKPTRSSIGPIRTSQGVLVSSDADIVAELNSYFVSVFTREDALGTPDPVVIYAGQSPLTEIVCTVEEVAEKIGKLDPNKSAGPDGFLPKVMKKVKDGLAEHLQNIFNVSLGTGEVVSDMRIANVTPIFKAGDTTDSSNYRPISLTSVPGKLLESIVKDRIVVHLEDNELIGKSQHGFLRGKSCLTNLLEFFFHIFQEHEKDRAVDIVYLDFKKAFDKVPHRRLLRKVAALGVGGLVLQWIEAWLSDRSQRVVVNGVPSTWGSVTSGVPQGSVLGPLLFIIYINDLDVGLVSRVSKFADDTKIGINAANPEAIRQLQCDLGKIGEWSEKWQMPFNVGKCTVLHAGRLNAEADYTLLGAPVRPTDVQKDLGVMITSDLKFSRQCLEAERRANKILGYIKRQFRYRNRVTVLSLYNSLVRPLLEYAVQFWSPTLRADINRLERVQARATKLVPEIRFKGYARRLEDLGLFTLEQRRMRGQLIETYKILTGISRVNPDDYFTLCTNRTRNHGWKVVPPRFSTPQLENFMLVKVCNVWNRLPSDVVNSLTVDTFKRRLDRILTELTY